MKKIAQVWGLFPLRSPSPPNTAIRTAQTKVFRKLKNNISNNLKYYNNNLYIQVLVTNYLQNRLHNHLYNRLHNYSYN